MKYFILVVLVPLFCCGETVDSDSVYLDEYRKYKSSVYLLVNDVDKSTGDAINHILDEYERNIAPLSCSFCVVEESLFSPIEELSYQEDGTLVFVLDRALKGTRLSWAFRELFRTHYPIEFDKLIGMRGLP